MPYFIGISPFRYLLKSRQCESDNQNLISDIYPQLEHIELAHMADRFSVDRTERAPKNDNMMIHR